MVERRKEMDELIEISNMKQKNAFIKRYERFSVIISFVHYLFMFQSCQWIADLLLIGTKSGKKIERIVSEH